VEYKRGKVRFAGHAEREQARGARRGSRRAGHRAAGYRGRLPGRHRHVGRPGRHRADHELEDRARPAGDADRRASGLAGDDPAAVAAVAELTDRIGYDPVRLGRLRAGRVLQPGGPVFGQVLTLAEFERAVHEDARSLT
jgi:hypothetical protein